MIAPVESRIKRWLLFVMFTVATSAAYAQDAWPTHSIRLIVPYPPGGSTDILARLVAQRLGTAIGQTIVVDNKGGANGVVAATYFAKTTSDDYTLMIASLPIMAVNPYLFKNLGYDPRTDFTPLGLIAQTPNVIVVTPALGVKTLAELIARARTSAKPLAYSSSGIGSSGHLLNELLKTATGTQLIHAPYRGNGPAMAALLAGEVQFTTDNLPQLLPQIRAGSLQALAVTSSKRWFQLPDVPTAAESGYPALTSSAWFGLVARAKVSPAVVARVNRELNAMLNQPDFVAKLHEVSFEPMPGTPQDMAAAAERERPIWKKAIETSGATAD